MKELNHEELYEKAMVARDKSSFNGDEGDYKSTNCKEFITDEDYEAKIKETP